MYQAETTAFWTRGVFAASMPVAKEAACPPSRYLHLVTQEHLDQIKRLDIHTLVDGHPYILRLTAQADTTRVFDVEFPTDNRSVAFLAFEVGILNRVLDFGTEKNRHLYHSNQVGLRFQKYMDTTMQQFETLLKLPKPVVTEAQMRHFFRKLMQQWREAEQRREGIAKTWKRQQFKSILEACFDAL